MHALIGISVEATNSADAVEEAKDYFNTILLDNYGIDYGSPKTGGKEENGGGLRLERYEDIPAPCNVLSPEGKAFAERCMENTKMEFYEHIRKVREGLDAVSDDNLWSGTPNYDSMVRYHMHEAGAYGGSAIRLYDQVWGEGVKDEWSYDHVQTRWNEDNNPETWIVAFDIHH
jgi:hypothetical protein